MGFETKASLVIALLALLLSGISLWLSSKNRRSDQRISAAEKLSEVMLLIGQVEVALQQNLTELAAAVSRTKSRNSQFGIRFSAMRKKDKETLRRLHLLRAEAESLRTKSLKSEIIIELEGIRSRLELMQLNTVFTIEEVREVSTAIEEYEAEG